MRRNASNGFEQSAQTTPTTEGSTTTKYNVNQQHNCEFATLKGNVKLSSAYAAPEVLIHVFHSCHDASPGSCGGPTTWSSLRRHKSSVAMLQTRTLLAYELHMSARLIQNCGRRFSSNRVRLCLRTISIANTKTGPRCATLVKAAELSICLKLDNATPAISAASGAAWRPGLQWLFGASWQADR